MQDNEILDRVTELLEWYENNHSLAPIKKLLNFQTRLSLLSVNLAQMTAKSKGSYLRAYFNRKYAFSKKKVHYMDAGETGAKAEELARLKIGDVKKAEIEAEEYVDGLNLTLRQVNKVLSAVQQQISFEKAEWDRMHRMSHDNS